MQYGGQMEPHHAQQLKQFWKTQKEEIQEVGNDPNEFKNHQLPLARIKKIMKSDEDVRMISAEAPVLFAKACEMFILELTLRSWIHSEENKRRTLQRNDIAAAITKTDIFDFLVDIVPRDDVKEEGLSGPRQGVAPGGGMPQYGMPYYTMPPPGQGGDMAQMAGQQYMMPGQGYMYAPGQPGMPPGMPPGGGGGS